MANPPELWTYAFANLVPFVLGTLLSVLSFSAYRASGYRRSFRDATAGFGFLTAGIAVAPIYQFGVKGQPGLAERELLAVQTVEGICLGIGLGLLFYSIYRHERRGTETVIEERA
jgi:hypothetical membrane protein